MGRPSDYSPDILPNVEALALSGATDEEIADSIGISSTTFYRWRHEHPEFKKALKENKDECDHRIERTLFRKASEGSETSMIFWLKNRKSQEWREKSEVAVTGNIAEIIAARRKRP